MNGYKKDTLERWTYDKSADLYGIQNWGAGYFDISEKGDVVIMPNRGNKNIRTSIMDIVSGLKDRGFDMPVLLRIENILDSQLTRIHENFKKAITTFGYKGIYKGVYPIKVNQQREVVEEVTQFGSCYHHGLEAGSKAELTASLAMLKDPEACLICNGYKDEEFVDLGLYATKMGFNCFFVLEMPSELSLILERAEALNIRPLIGVRIKLSSTASGHWIESCGDRSIFGLNTTQLVAVIDCLKEKNMLDCLQLLHYHIGSQVPNIRDIRSAVLEASQVYIGLVAEGAKMGYLDLGGGLAVDYDGSHTNYMHSRNYTLYEYCADVIETIMATLDEKNIDHPTIITESGRATVAYYSVLLFNILDISQFEALPLPDKFLETTPELIVNLFEVLTSMNLRNIQECYNDALYYRDEIRQLFKHGDISLRERSLGEMIFWHIIKKIAEECKKLKYIPQELKDIDVVLADIYYGNFSVFQSLPDAWAIDHLFPVMPIHRLNEEPTRQGILADITCDCDGKIDKFIDIHGVKRALPLHEFKADEEYYLGVFLVGAYQETLGDLHNLLGDTNVVTIRIGDDGDYSFVRESEGDSVADVLTYVEYDPKQMIIEFRKTAEEAVRKGLITPHERKKIMEAYDAGLRGYTYFEK
ncbi:MAG: biosynthetic arginine decarboxylase [Desulfobacterales bacterium]|nr:biosynthetic arginine decarboxylase [Desulfobacterales bacterium]MBF0398214.1 biosynthetic arginine decarboxylase [Desulfobacterales bacterium]